MVASDTAGLQGWITLDTHNTSLLAQLLMSGAMQLSLVYERVSSESLRNKRMRIG